MWSNKQSKKVSACTYQNYKWGQQQLWLVLVSCVLFIFNFFSFLFLGVGCGGGGYRLVKLFEIIYATGV